MSKAISINKWLTVLLLLNGWCHLAKAQVEVSHRGSWFFIDTVTAVYIRGNLSTLPPNTQQISLLGDIYNSGNVSCYNNTKLLGQFPDTLTAHFYMDGARLQQFGGTHTMRFGRITINNTADTVQLQNNVDVAASCILQAGNVDLQNFTLDFITTGFLYGEINPRRIYGSNYGKIHAQRFLQNGTTNNHIAGLGIGFTVSSNLGTFCHLYRYPVSQTTASSGSVKRVWGFNPQNTGIVSNPKFNYFDNNELDTLQETDLAFYQSANNGVTWTEKRGNVHGADDYIDGFNGQLLLSPTTLLTAAIKECVNPPFIDFQPDTVYLCSGQTATLLPMGIAGMASVWSTGQTNTNAIQVSDSGWFKVTITDLNGCPNSDSVYVAKAPSPVTDFFVGPECLGTPSVFTNTSTLATGTMTYQWNFNDLFTAQQDTSSAINPSFVYAAQGSFTVVLTATSDKGCVTTKTKSATVLPFPVASYSFSDRCEDSLVQFTNATTINNGAGIAYQWAFGDGATSTVVSPQHTYTTFGAYTVQLLATSNGCTDTLRLPIEIHPNPVAQFTVNDACLNTISSFSNTTQLSSGTISYAWDFANGTTTSNVNPAITYLQPGIYNVTLTATSDHNCNSIAVVPANVLALPIPTFSTVATCSNDSVLFVNTSTSTSTFVWDLGDGSTSLLDNPHHLYTSFGTKTVGLTETDIHGCEGDTTQPVYVLESPVADFAIQTSCATTIVQPLNASLATTSLLTYQWNSGAAQTSTLAQPQFTYAAAGTYNIELIATSQNSCTDTIVKSILIQPLPVVNLGGTISTCGNSYTLDAQNPGSVFLWSNGISTATTSIVASGSYWVMVEDANGCVNADTVQVALAADVVPNLGAQTVFCETATLNAGYPNSTYNWSTGESSQTITVTNSGTYSVQVTDQNNCVGYDTLAIIVHAVTYPALGADAGYCANAIAALTAGVPNATFEWSTGATSASIVPATTGQYWVKATDANGCITTDTVAIELYAIPQVDLGADQHICDSLSFDVTTTNATYLWENGFTGAQRTVSAAGQYWIQITENTHACVNTDTLTVTFSNSPVVDLGPDTVLCFGETYFIDATTSAVGYAWNTGEPTSAITVYSSGVYSVTATNSDGCTTVNAVDIAILPAINLDLGTDHVLCNGESATFYAPQNLTQYQWFINDTLQTVATDSIVVNQFGELVAVVTNSGGCQATDTVEVIQNGNFVAIDFLVSTNDVQEEDTLKFINLSSPAPLTNYWAFGDGTFSIDEDPLKVYVVNGTYQVELTVSNGICTNTVSKQIVIKPKTKNSFAFPQDTVLDFVAVNLYPNPANNQLNLDIDLSTEGNIELNCFDMQSRVLFTDQLAGMELHPQYDIQRLAPGMYFISLKLKGRYKQLKFIKL